MLPALNLSQVSAINLALIPDKTYTSKDFDNTMVIDERTQLVAENITKYLQQNEPLAKTIVFCEDIDHAARMRQALINLNSEQVKLNDILN